MGRIEWVRPRGGKQDSWLGKIGDVIFFTIKPWDRNNQPGYELTCHIPGWGSENLRPYDTEEQAQGWAEELLKDILKKSGLQPKPIKPKTVPAAVRRVETFLEHREIRRKQSFSRHGHPAQIESVTDDNDKTYELTVADLTALVKLAKKGAS